MKTYWRIAILTAVVGAVLLGFLTFRKARTSESAIIAGARDKIAASEDRQRMANDAAYAHEIRSKLRFLDYRLAVAYNRENRPDDAIAVLRELVSPEEKGGDLSVRGSRSYLEEARHYAALEVSYALKQDQAGAEHARRQVDALKAKAEAAKKRERQEEGSSVSSSRE